jgi:hypothetical protein
MTLNDGITEAINVAIRMGPEGRWSAIPPELHEQALRDLIRNQRSNP